MFQQRILSFPIDHKRKTTMTTTLPSVLHPWLWAREVSHEQLMNHLGLCLSHPFLKDAQIILEASVSRFMPPTMPSFFINTFCMVATARV
jgi:hypothetical protein